jgi:hypothetical protein
MLPTPRMARKLDLEQRRWLAVFAWRNHKLWRRPEFSIPSGFC